MLRDTGTYHLALKLRRSGYSYNYISKTINVPKSTLSGWFSRYDWSKVLTKTHNCERLKKFDLSPANNARRENDQKRHAAYTYEAQRQFEDLKTNPLFNLGLGIYWGEGDKTNNGRVAVINSDPNLIKTAVNFYENCLRIPKDKLRIGLFLYPDLDKKTIINFWAKYLEIPRKQFIKIQLLPSRSNLTKRKLQHGICSVYFSSTELSIKIHTWIDMLSRDDSYSRV